MTNKWGKKYWKDVGERVATTAIYGLIAMLTADTTGAVSGSAEQWWLVVGLPATLSLLKSLLVNLGGGDDPTASVVNVTSDGRAT